GAGPRFLGVNVARSTKPCYHSSKPKGSMQFRSGFSPPDGANANASFFLGSEVPVPALRPDVPLWQEKLYAFMTRNAVRAPDYFLIPPARVVELGTKVEM